LAIRPDFQHLGVHPLDEGQKQYEFFGFSACRKKKDDVACADHAQVSVEGIQDVERKALGPEACHGGGDLFGDQARFPHACRNDLAFAPGELHHGTLEVFFE